MTAQVWRCDVPEGAAHDGHGPCTRTARHIVTWYDEADEKSTMKVCNECLESVRHSLQWDVPTVVEHAVAPLPWGPR